jgi:hypothetical protein
METAGRRHKVRQILRAVALLAAAAAAAATFAAGNAHPTAPHHALAENGVITGDD